MTVMPVTLASAAAAALLNMWLSSRIGKFRKDFKVSVGDGGHEPLLRRMRAQANFIENAPIVLILIAALELSGANRFALVLIAGLFILFRIAHAVGMDGGELRRWRMVGMMGSTIVTFALVIWAIVCAVETCLGR